MLVRSLPVADIPKNLRYIGNRLRLTKRNKITALRSHKQASRIIGATYSRPMGVPTSEVGYTIATTRRETTKVHKNMWWHWGERNFSEYLIK